MAKTTKTNTDEKDAGTKPAEKPVVQTDAKQQEQGYMGVKVDDRPNSDYTAPRK